VGDRVEITKALRKPITDAGSVSGGTLVWSGYNVIFDDAGYNPGNGETFVSIFDLPASAPVVELGDVGTEEFTGILQLDVSIPRGADTITLAAILDDLKPLYKAGSQSASSDVKTVFTRVDPTPLRRNGGWVTMGISVTYQSYLVRS